MPSIILMRDSRIDKIVIKMLFEKEEKIQPIEFDLFRKKNQTFEMRSKGQLNNKVHKIKLFTLKPKIKDANPCQ